MKVAWTENAIETVRELKSIRFTSEETFRRQEYLIRVIEDKVLSYGAGARRAAERNRRGSFVIVTEGYRIYYSFRKSNDKPYILIEDVRHGRQL